MSAASTEPLLLALGLAPFGLLAAILFARFLLVLGLFRHALGTPRVPPALLCALLSAALTLLLLLPLAPTSPPRGPSPAAAWQAGFEPLRGFVQAHTSSKDLAFFEEQARRQTQVPEPSLVLLAAFALSQFRDALILGLLLFLPFLVVDLVVANSLLAAGLHALDPDRVSLPFKLLLFVAMDGWTLLVRGLLLGY